jgi:hypothetical protein
VLKWTISNGTCAVSEDEVSVKNDALPTTANAGTDQEKCNDGSFTLAGNTPTSGTGVWSVQSGTATITTPTSASSGVTGIPVGTSATLRWSITNGVCTSSIDDVILTNSVAPTTANAGADQSNCNSGSFTLNGNNPSTGSGTWSVVSGTATITTPGAYNSGVTGVPVGTSATLRWTITNGTCSPSTDDVILTNNNPPSVNAGDDQSGCSTGSITLAGSALPSGATGLWTVQSGGTGTFGNSASPTSTFSAATGNYVLRWTITASGCSPVFDEVNITVASSPTTAAAGPDISQCTSTTFTMAANTATVGTGSWSVVSGDASITSASSPTTTVTLNSGSTATLTWTITNAPCDPSSDNVIITYNPNNQWIGVTSSDWKTGSNWSCGTAPTSASSVTIAVVETGRSYPNINITDAELTGLTINTGATLNMSAGSVLTFANGGTMTNNGTFNASTGTVVFNGTGTIAGASSTTFNDVTINGGVNFGSGLSTINGTLRINANGFANTNGPRYGASSTLRYSTGGNYDRNAEWNHVGIGTLGTNAGYPNNVLVDGNTFVRMAPNSNAARALHGNLTIESGSTLSMAEGSSMTGALTVRGNAVINGTLTLSGNTGGDLDLLGNMTVGTSGTFNPNNRSVRFNSSTANQTITKTGNGTINFSYLNIDNTASSGKVILATGTNLRIASTNSNTSLRVLQLTNGDLDLNGQTLELNGSTSNTTNIQVSNGTRRITGNTGSSVSVTGTATGGSPNLNVYPIQSTDRLIIDGGAALETSVGVVFTNTTFNGIFRINQNGFVAGSTATDAPVYGSSSTLIYNNGSNGFNRNYEWTAASGTLGTTPGYPNNVIVQNNTPLDIGNTGVSSGILPLAIAGNLEIGAGSSVTMSAMNQTLTVNGNVDLNGGLTLSTNAAGTLNIGGNWTRGSAGTITQNSRAIRFFGSALQTITKTGGETLGNVVVDKSGQKLELGSNLTIDGTLAIDNGTFDVATNALVLNDQVTKGAGGTLSSAATGVVLYNKSSDDQTVIAANYGNLTFSNFNKTLPSSGTIRVAGEFTPGTGSGHTITGSTIEFNGAGAQTVPEFNYNNLTISGARSNSNITLATGTIGVAGNFTTSGATDIGAYVLTGNTVDFNGTTSQSIDAFNFNNLRISGNKNNGTITLGNGTIRVNGDFTASASAVGSYTTTGNTFEFTGNSASNSMSIVTSMNFNNLVINKSGQSLIVTNPSSIINIAGDHTLTAGQFLVGNSAINMTGGNWTNNGATFSRGNSTVVFSGTGDQEIGGTTTAAQEFANLTMNKVSGTLSIAAGKAIKVDKDLLLTAGTFAPATGTTVEFDKLGETQPVPLANYHHLKLSRGGTKNLADNVAVAGDLLVENPAAGTTTVVPNARIRFNGNSAQAIAGLPFRSVEMSGTGNKRFTDNASIIGAMTFNGGSGTVDLDGTSNDKLFTVRSTVDSTARIANVGSWTLSGKAVVERYVPGQRKWRLISVPTVPGETLRQALTRQIDGTYPNPICFTADAQAGSGTLITGHSMSSCTNATSVGFDHLVSGGESSVRFYNSAASNAWASATSTPNVLAPPTQSGYLVFIRGDRQSLNTGFNNTTLRPKGDLIQGNYNIPINQRFVVLGNPYASPISFESLYEFGVEGGNSTKIRRTFWTWDANLTNSVQGVGGYRSISPDDSTSANPTYTMSPSTKASGTTESDYLMINSGQAIMVERVNSSITGNVVVKETHKVGNKGNTINLRTSNTPVGKIKVDMYRANGTTLEIPMDGVVARFADWYDAEPTDVFDVYKQNQFQENLSFSRRDKGGVLRYMSIESRPTPTVNDTIFMPFYQMSNRGYALKLSAENMITSNLKAYLQDAFTGTETEVPLNGSEMIYPFSVTADANSKALSRLRVVFRPGTITNVVDWMGEKGISIYPNPAVKGSDVQVQFRNSRSGKYDVTIYTLTGVRVLQTQVVHPGGSSVQKATLPAEFASGTYIMELTSPNGDSGKTKLIVQ